MCVCVCACVCACVCVRVWMRACVCVCVYAVGMVWGCVSVVSVNVCAVSESAHVYECWWWGGGGWLWGVGSQWEK